MEKDVGKPSFSEISKGFAPPELPRLKNTEFTLQLRWVLEDAVIATKEAVTTPGYRREHHYCGSGADPIITVAKATGNPRDFLLASEVAGQDNWASERVIKGMLETGLVGMTDQVIEKGMTDQFRLSRAYAEIASVTQRPRDWNTAIIAARRVGNSTSRRQAMANVGVLITKTGNMESALVIAQEIEASHFEDPDSHSSDIFEAMTLYLIESGNLELARQLEEKITGHYQGEGIAVSFALAKAKTGDYEGARREIIHISDEEMRSQAMINLGRITHDPQDLEAALRIAEEYDHDLISSQLIADIIRAHLENNDLEKARSLVIKIPSPDYQSWSWADIGRTSQNFRDFDNAMEIVKEKMGPLGRDEALVRIVSTLAEAEYFTEARRIVSEEMDSNYLRSRAMANIGLMSREVEDFREALSIAQKNLGNYPRALALATAHIAQTLAYIKRGENVSSFKTNFLIYKQLLYKGEVKQIK